MGKTRIIMVVKEDGLLGNIFDKSKRDKIKVKSFYRSIKNSLKLDKDYSLDVEEFDELNFLENNQYKKLGTIEKEDYRSYTIDCEEQEYSKSLFKELSINQNVESVYMDGVVQLAAKPNDSFFNRQFSLSEMKCEQAWDFTKGSQNILVSVIDTGVNFNHQDLKANLWKNNSGEFGNNFSNDSTIFDNENHGTSVAGIIGAVGNNNLGIVGVAYECKIMINKAFDEGTQTAFLSDCQAAIKNSIDNGAKVINCSFEIVSNKEKEAIMKFQNYINSVSDKVVLVFAAGNYGSDIASTPWGQLPSTIKVGALDKNNRVWDEKNGINASNFGKDVVFSHGVDLIGITNDLLTSKNPVLLSSGTSFAAPHVSGVCALIYSYNSMISPSQVRHIIRNSLDRIPAITSNIGLGKINAFKALKLTSESFAKMNDNSTFA
jgi:thermitase